MTRRVLLHGVVSCLAAGLVLGAPRAAAGDGDASPRFDAKLALEATLTTDLDAPDGTDPVVFALPRADVWLGARLFPWAAVKFHARSAAVDGRLEFTFLDGELVLRFHPAVEAVVGRMKKRYTRVFAPSWTTWNFFDLPESFQFARKDLGLAGRDLGAVLQGAFADGLFGWRLGVFNGLDEARAKADGTHRTDEAVEVIARLEVNPLAGLSVGAGAAWLPQTKRLVPDPADATQLVATDLDLVSWAADVAVDVAGLEVDAEFIGHAQAPDTGATVLGGGFHVDVLYRIALPLGELQPGVRFARHWPDFDRTERHDQRVTGVLNWWVGWQVHAGLEYTWLRSAPAETDTHTLLVLLSFLYPG